jgi:D-alanyl-D-alanine carboxypeptidase
MAIGSVTKTVVAAQTMQLVEAGRLKLEDPASSHLPTSLLFDSNHATVGDLLGMRSGIPDYVDAIWSSLTTDKRHVWSPPELLARVRPDRALADAAFDYSSTNYVLLGSIIENVTGRPLAEVLRDGVLSGPGLQRLIYQPAERPTEPMAVPGGAPARTIEEGGGFLPSLAGATAAGPAGGMASDSATLARWWGRLCGGRIVSDASFGAMTDFGKSGEYGLGMWNMSDVHGPGAVGSEGLHVGFTSKVVCLPEQGLVVTVLANDETPVGPVVSALAARLLFA